jgi:hypothetical protein
MTLQSVVRGYQPHDQFGGGGKGRTGVGASLIEPPGSRFSRLLNKLAAPRIVQSCALDVIHPLSEERRVSAVIIMTFYGPVVWKQSLFPVDASTLE